LSNQKGDRRKTVTFFGDLEPISVNVESKTTDFFPLPPPLLPHISLEQDEDNPEKTSEPVDKNSPDFVESRV
jgi:hypothetical protein